MGDTSKQFSLQNFRPTGFEYPIGLSSAGSNTNIDYLVIAGGGGGGGDTNTVGGGGGGAGGYLTGSNITLSAGSVKG